MAYSQAQKETARDRYFRGDKTADIARETGIEIRTLYNWISDENWNAKANRNNTVSVIERRIWTLVNRDDKTVNELFELERMVIHYERLKKLELRIQRPKQTGSTDSDGETPAKRRGRKPSKNDFTTVTPEQVEDYLKQGLFGYQLILWERRKERSRNILKSRQIGLTFYFAKEAFCDALLTGRNKIFLSASRAQADVFKEYIKFFALEGFEVDLKGGDKVELHTQNGVATLYFLSTNSSTAQSYHGDVYIDEYFWIPNFTRLKKVASAMASQKRWTKTYFSTPSSTGHEAYPFWSGDEFNERNKRANRAIVDFPGKKSLRKEGQLCADGQWRWIVTLDDAEAMGCNLFDKAQLQLEYSEDEYRQLFDCEFIDEANGVFSYSQMKPCLGERENFPPDLAKRRVWIGYDPSRTRDGACIIVMSKPTTYRGKMYVIEKITLHNVSWPAQAEQIKDLTKKYDVEKIIIDNSGCGSGVYEFVQLFFPRAQAVTFTPETKKMLVLKAQQIIDARRVTWDAGYSDIAAGFLTIRRSYGASEQVLYRADRTERTGHADAAWAVMLALSGEELILPDQERKSVWG